MTQPYWFTRSISQSKPLKRIESTSKPIQLDLKKQKGQLFQAKTACRASAEKMLVMVESFQQLYRLNQLAHGQLFEAGSIKELICLRHGSPVILYCLSDRRLLCSTCTFTTAEHTKHRLQQARTCLHDIQLNAVNYEKVLRLKITQLLEQNHAWRKISDRLQLFKNETLTNLEQQHQSISAQLSSLYERSKIKIENVFEQTSSNLTFITKTIENLAASLKCSHSLPIVRQLYLQEIMMRFNDFSHMMPSIKLGERMTDSTRLSAKIILKNFRETYNAIKR